MEAHAYAGIFRVEEDLWWYRGRRSICFDLLDRHLPKGSDLDILDFGCGTGYNLELLKRYGRARGVDMSPEALEFCRRRGVENVILHEEAKLPFEDESFDLVTAFDVIEHIEDDRGALVEMRRVLRPGGCLLIYTPALPWLYSEHDRLVHHQRRYMKRELGNKMTEAGFELNHLAYSNLLVLPGVMVFKVIFWLLGRGKHLEMNVPPTPVNEFCAWLCELEKPLVMGRGLPLGMSLVAVGRKV